MYPFFVSSVLWCMMLSKLNMSTALIHSTIPRAVTNRIAFHMKQSGSSSHTRLKSLSKTYKPKSTNQHSYVSQLASNDVDIVIGVGPAGTGKTLFACNAAVDKLRSGSIGKIVITRPVVSVEEDIGFLPGNLVMKMDPWTRPIFDILLELYTQKDIDSMIHAGTIEISPLAYMRGRTFKRAFVIADEMQNSSPSQMLMLMTRMGEGSKLVITGDLNQSDRMKDNGLRDLLQRMKRTDSVPGIGCVELDMEDVERSKIVRSVLKLYESSSLDTPTASLDTPTAALDKVASLKKRSSPRKPRSPAASNNTSVVSVSETTPISHSTVTISTEWENVSNEPTGSDAAIIPRSNIPRNSNQHDSTSDFKWIRW